MTENKDVDIEDTESFYCKTCTGCGEEGCCDSLNCAHACMVGNENCKYGTTYFNDIEFEVKMYREMYNNLSDASDIDEYRNTVEQIFQKLFDECYRRKDSNNVLS